MTKTLRDYQQKSLEILKKSTSGLDASEMGTGKTLVATERVRQLGIKGRVPRVLIIAPVNTHEQWIASFAEQYPGLGRSDFLRVVSTPQSDPQGWKFLTSKSPGVYVIGWEAMRGLAPYSVKVVNDDDPRKTKTVTGPVPEGWHTAPKSRASRGYGDLYNKNNITVSAIREAMKHGDVPPWSRTGTWDLVIADECHRMQDRTSSNRLVLRQIKTDHKLAASGTPAGNKVEGLWATINWLWPKRYPSFWSWAQLFLEIGPAEQVGYTTIPGKIVGELYPGAVWKDLPCVVRWRTEEVAAQLPGVVERVVTVPMGPKQRKIYDDFEKQAFTWLDEHPVVVDLPVVQRIRLRQAALGQLKASVITRQTELYRDADALRARAEQALADNWAARADRLLAEAEEADANPVEYIDEEFLDIDFAKTGEQPKIEAVKDIIADLPQDEPVVIFAHSAKWVRMCAEALDKSYGPARAWTGSLTKNQRAKLRADGWAVFGKDLRILVAQIASIAEGTDGLQFVCRNEIWASPSEDGLINQQAKARLHRPGQKHVVNRWLLHSQDSIDTDVDLTLRLRQKQMSSVYRDDKEKVHG